MSYIKILQLLNIRKYEVSTRTFGSANSTKAGNSVPNNANGFLVAARLYYPLAYFGELLEG
jgi:hypothetical protein